MQRFLNQQKGFLDRRKGDLGLLYMDEDEDEDEDESYEEIEGDESVEWDFYEEDWGLRSMQRLADNILRIYWTLGLQKGI